MGEAYEIILLITAAQGLLLATGLMVSVFSRGWSNFFLGLFILVISIEILTVWGINTGYHSKPDRFPFWILSTYWILPPSIYLFGKLNTRPGFRLKGWAATLFIPAIIELSTEFYADYSNMHLGTSIRLMEIRSWFIFTEILPLISMIVVLVVTGIDIKRLSSRLRELSIKNYAAHLNKVFIFYVIICLITLFWFLEAVFSIPAFDITLFILSICIYAIGYFSIISPGSFELPTFMKRPLMGGSEQPGDSNKDLKTIQEKLVEQKLYLKPKLRLKEAASHVDLPARKLSELINQHYAMDFRRYINSLRIEEVASRVEDGELRQKTLLAIALESGFNSKSAFNQAFKDLKGSSPSEYFEKYSK